MRKIFFTYLFVLFQIVAIADNQINVLNYNLYSPLEGKDENISLQKKAIEETLRNFGETIYSFGRAESNYNFHQFFTNKIKYSKHKLVANNTSHYQHYMLYDSTIVKLISSVAIQKKNNTILHYSFVKISNNEKFHILYLKTTQTATAYLQYQIMVNIINNLGINKNIILLGGSEYSLETKNQFLIKNTNNIHFRNPISENELYDKNNYLSLQKTKNLMYLSSDLWNLEQAIHYKIGSATLRTELLSNYTNKKLSRKQYGYPYSFTLNTTHYKPYTTTPTLNITSQNKEELNFKIQWSKATLVQMEIMSMIGNVFTKKSLIYEGGKQYFSVNISDYPTGIFILKVEDKDGKVLLRKFTKY